MNYRLFGRTGLRASELILGTMTFGDAWGEFGASADESRKIFNAYVERGGNFIDTANGYTNGQSEEIVGALLGSQRERFILATKYTFNPTTDDPNAGGNHRKSIVRSLDASLKRLKTDYVDIYWLHAWDFTTPVEEVMRALDDQVRAGKILHAAVSDTPAWIAAEANTIAPARLGAILRAANRVESHRADRRARPRPDGACVRSADHAVVAARGRHAHGEIPSRQLER
jgi:aryl-alcohol dehydrogenase-like predicted oxidoreductase